MPDTAVDPVVAAAALVRSAGAGLIPGAGVEWSGIHGGTRFNIIPERVSVSGILEAPERDFEVCRSRLEENLGHIMAVFRTEGVLQFTEEGL